MNNLDKIEKHLKWDQYYDPTFNWHNHNPTVYTNKFSKDFLIEFAEQLDWHQVYLYQQYDEDIIKSFIWYYDKLTFNLLSKNQQLSEEFIETYSSYVDWIKISQYQILSERFMAKHYDQLDWPSICKHQKLSEDFIEKFADLVDWNLIFEYQYISQNFISKYQDEYRTYLNAKDINEIQYILEQQQDLANLFDNISEKISNIF